MQIESDGKYIIFTPITEFDFFNLGKIQERCKKFEYRMSADKLSEFKISKENILDILLRMPV